MAFSSCSLYCLAGLSEADASASCSFPSSASRASTLSSLCADSHASCFFYSAESLVDGSETDWFDDGRHEIKTRANRMDIIFFITEYVMEIRVYLCFIFLKGLPVLLCVPALILKIVENDY